ncbi:hypothetical protein CGRA01v4_08755 [Colletotrichum graminicola]|uniref:Atos-like conserved domain-containing protein n=1 Tax=Colletotrichum graminicola (strain M1.001 / M2 / FGSC 10212) TaxID=645133 RepID=E3QQQ9_COLGM|nr:uncharacterized protein GLRG_08341 [Colletotrichum graminicola M1.001]EFQ33197.1 hypothetical protein GLRG_08341 [Colletotrichum graminicola M1.001]WDK17472.1 hypothetical protein CGRA01v4_08755 [Colletotrichum graminicola]
MPIFQDDLERSSPVADCPDATESVSVQQQTNIPSLARKLSEESIRTELCEGLVLESPRLSTPESDAAAVTSDRAELIERLKRGESPTWVPNRHVGSPRSAKDTPFAHNITQLESLFNNLPRPTTPRSPRPRSSSSNLLPPARITPEKTDGPQEDDERFRDGLSIQRPRSALHSGDFTEEQPRGKQQGAQKEEEQNPMTIKSLASRNSWIATSPPQDFSAFQFEGRIPFPVPHDDYRSVPSSLSSSFSSSFVYKPPTSPLVQSESNDDIDLSEPLHSIDIAASPLNVNSRRHTLNSVASSPFAVPSPIYPALQGRSSHRGTTLPYQAHQPRRSLTSTPKVIPSGALPQTPAFLRPRRPSFNADTSPLQHASMVGSYEESILRGRMSTTPSKPLDFLAQIGVLGLGRCKSSLRCPAHVTLPFPAVFYSYGGTPQGHVRSEDGPSPYVGQIDLENGLPNPEEGQRSKRKMQSRVAERRIVEDDVVMGDVPAMADGSDCEARRAQRARRRSGSPRAPPGGSYRIPEKGQIQIVIKNPNKTAVKLFLVPYDLAGMEPGTKTFIRQRSYSAGPIMENAPGLEEAASSDRPILRYLVHLHICCPAKGRYYLYKSVRIVFANRVPDGKEKLRNETTCPEPRYTPYKPVRVMHPPLSNCSGPAATLTAEKAFRRRSAVFPLGQSLHGLEAPEGLSRSPQAMGQQSSPSPFSFGDNNQPVEAIPFALSGRTRHGSDISDSTNTATTTPGVLSPQSSQASRPTTKDGWEEHIARYQKLNKGDVGYGGNAFAPFGLGSLGGTEGLLSQRLRSLGVQNNQGELPSNNQESRE